MGAILVPGFMAWDGTKYVIQEIDIPIGPAGPTGSIGPNGPDGYAGAVGVTNDFITNRFIFQSSHSIKGILSFFALQSFNKRLLSASKMSTLDMFSGVPFGLTTKYYFEGFFQTGQFDIIVNIDSTQDILFTYNTSTSDWEYFKQEITLPTNPYTGSIGIVATPPAFTTSSITGFSIYGEWS